MAEHGDWREIRSTRLAEPGAMDAYAAAAAETDAQWAIVDLADRPTLIEPVGELRWKEWGRPPEPVDPGWWIDATRRESGRANVPVTFAAVTPSGTPVGAVGLGEFDIEECRDRSPWVLGLVVLPAWRGRGIGRTLLSCLEAHAAVHGYDRVWVATGEARPFYQHCGWSPTEELVNSHGDPMTVLVRPLDSGSGFECSSRGVPLDW